MATPRLIGDRYFSVAVSLTEIATWPAARQSSLQLHFRKGFRDSDYPMRRASVVARGSLQLEGAHDPTMPQLWR